MEMKIIFVSSYKQIDLPTGIKFFSQLPPFQFEVNILSANVFNGPYASNTHAMFLLWHKHLNNAVNISQHLHQNDTICTMRLVKEILLKCLLLLCRCKRVVKILQQSQLATTTRVSQ